MAGLKQDPITGATWVETSTNVQRGQDDARQQAFFAYFGKVCFGLLVAALLVWGGAGFPGLLR